MPCVGSYNLKIKIIIKLEQVTPPYNLGWCCGIYATVAFLQLNIQLVVVCSFGIQLKVENNNTIRK